MTPAQAREAHADIKTTLDRVQTNYVKQYSGRTVMGTTVFNNRVSQREYNALLMLAEVAERLTPEALAALLNGQEVRIEKAGKKVGEPDLNFH